MKKLFFEKTTHEGIRILRALFVGIFSTIFDIAVLFVMTDFFGFFYQIGVVCGFLVGAIVNYILTHLWVFSREKISRKRHTQDFFAFGIIGIIGLFLTMGFIFFFHEVLHFSLFIAKILSLVVFFWNYGARKYFIFEPKEK